MAKIWKLLAKKRIYLALILTSAVVYMATLAPNHLVAISDQTIVSYTNTKRQANGLQPLAWDARLSTSAWLKAQDMCEKDYWAHIAPDGTTPWSFISKAGYNYKYAGENLAKGFSADNEVISAWMASPEHRANILSTKFTNVGVASSTCDLSGIQTTIIVAHYGTTGSSSQSTTASESKPSTKPKPIKKVTTPPATKQITSAPNPITKPPEIKQLTYGEKLWRQTFGKKSEQLFMEMKSNTTKVLVARR